MLFSVRDIDVLRLLCWCQNIHPDDLNGISTATERENLFSLGYIKRHEKSDTLTLSESGKSFLHVILEGNIPNLTFSYHESVIVRRIRLSKIALTAYHAGIDVFTTSVNSMSDHPSLFLTAIARGKGRNPWGSARVGAITNLGGVYYSTHYDPDKDMLEISIKETEVNPFFGAEQRHPVGSRRLAVISGKYGGGVFCNLPDGVVCMCNYSYQHEDADFMVGENVMLIVQRYENEKLQMYGKIMSKW